VTYVDVSRDPTGLDAMLVASKGRRAVPVIVDLDGGVTIGYGGT
jgi:hypothetical protein